MITLHEAVAPGLDAIEGAHVATLPTAAARPGGALNPP